MRSGGRKVKLTAVAALVVLTLTGFSTGRHKSDGDSDGSGGGCSSSSQDHDSSTSSTSGGGSDGGSGSVGSSATRDGTARLLTCATKAKPYATIEVTNPNDVSGTFEVHIVFEDAKEHSLSDNTEEVVVPANQTRTVQVAMYNGETRAAKVDTCNLDPDAVLVP
jgi:hypothetical protein